MNRLTWRSALSVSVIILLAVGSIWVWLTIHQAGVLPIKTVKISGTFNHLTNAEIERVAMPYVDTGFFSVDLNGLSQSLLNIPWVAAVSVTRIWPDTLKIAITEQQAYVRWNNGMLNANGQAFYPAQQTIPTDLPWLQGPQGQQQQIVATYQKMRTMLAKSGLAIVQLQLNDRWAWSLLLNNGIKLLIGRGHAEQHLTRFVNVYQKVLAARAADVAQVDLRYPNGMAVSWKNK